MRDRRPAGRRRRPACPPTLHNRPERHPGRGRGEDPAAAREGYERIFVAYADCGTGGLLDPVLDEEGVERLPGAHCYEFFAGRAAFAALADDEPATFYLTDFLARNFERLVIRGLGHRPPPGARCRCTSATTAASSTSPDRRPGAARAGARRPPTGSGSRSSTADDRPRRARDGDRRVGDRGAAPAPAVELAHARRPPDGHA